MAQLPLRIPTTYYISNDTTIATYDKPRPLTENAIKPPKISSTQSNADHKVIKSILCFFCSPKRKQGANPSSSKNFKFIACFSNPPPDEPLCSGFSDSSEGFDTQVHKQDNEKIERNISDSSEDDNNEGIEYDSCFSYDFQFEDSNVLTTNSVGDSREVANYLIEDSPNDATEFEVTSASNDSEEIKLDLFRSQNKEMVIAAFNSMRSLPTSHVHGLSPFVVKIQKVMSYPRGLIPTILTKDAKRKLEILLLSLDNKHKSFFKKENQQQIWTKPILMGKRCRKLEDDFPYGDDPSSNGSKIDGNHELP